MAEVTLTGVAGEVRAGTPQLGTRRYAPLIRRGAHTVGTTDRPAVGGVAIGRNTGPGMPTYVFNHPGFVGYSGTYGNGLRHLVIPRTRGSTLRYSARLYGGCDIALTGP